MGDSKENYKIKEIAETIAGQIRGSMVNASDTVKDRRDYRVSFKKINKVLKFKTTRTLPDGIAELLKSMKKGAFKDWQSAHYSNYLTLKSVLEEVSSQ